MSNTSDNSEGLPNNGKRVFGNRYEIDHKIARGGMADVYLARDTLLDRPVALKVLFPELSVDPSFVERFRREAQNAAQLSHPNIVSVYDWGEEDSTYYIVMEYLDGKPLSVILRERGPLQSDEAAKIGADVAAALSFAHRNGVIHRDVKPGNVLIDARGAVKVTDFGIARARNTTENLTQTGAVMGTATYFSPEQAQGLDVDQRSDVYSLGVVLYEMAAGKPPFQGDNPVTIAYKHVRENPTPLGEVNSLIPTDYQAVVSQAITKLPANRYQSAEELRADLNRFLNGVPVKATPVAPAPTMAERRTINDAYADSTRTIPAAYSPYQQQPATSKPKEGKSLVTPLLIFISLLAIIAIIALLIFGGVFNRDARNVTVPELTGKTLEEATKILKEENIGFTVDRQASDKPENEIIDQSPDAGVSILSTQRIALTVSSGPEQLSIPNVVNESATEATKTLQNLGLKVVTKEEASDTYDVGKVISQDPRSGTSARKGDTITLTVSSGPEQIEVPDVTGFTVSVAAQKLSTAGLRTSIPSGASQNTLVINTNPAAGTKVPKGSTVALITQTPTTTTTTTSSTTSTTSSTTTTTTP